MTSVDIKPRNDTPKSLFNPLKIDFVTEIRDEHNVLQTYIVHSMEIETFPTWLANILEKKLITMIKNERNINPIYSSEDEKIKKEVEVVI